MLKKPGTTKNDGRKLSIFERQNPSQNILVQYAR